MSNNYVARGYRFGRGALAAVLAFDMLGLVACGNVSDSPDAVPDAPRDAAPRRCDPNKPFGPAQPLTEFNSDADDDGAWLTNDELTIYFSSNRADGLGGFDIYRSTRTLQQSPWKRPELEPGVNTDGMDRRPSLTADGLALYACRQTVGNDYDLLVATRSSPLGRFGALMTEPTLNGQTSFDSSPYMMADRSILFESDRSGRRDLYQATWNGTEYTQITMLGGLRDRSTTTGSTSYNSAPIMTEDKLTLYFASTREGSLGSEDIWVATRATPTSDFDHVTNLSALNTPDIDSPNWISGDGCVLNFTRRIPDGPTVPAHYDLYEAVKPL